MRKLFVLFIVCVLILTIGCSQKAHNTNSSQTNTTSSTEGQNATTISNITLKSKAEADIANASSIGFNLASAYAMGKINTFDKDQELKRDSYYGKILTQSMLTLPEVKINPAYKFYVSFSEDGMITVKAGEKPETSVQIYPKPQTFSPPYDILNK